MSGRHDAVKSAVTVNPKGVWTSRIGMPSRVGSGEEEIEELSLGHIPSLATINAERPLGPSGALYHARLVTATVSDASLNK